jgi:hypothetical protein
VQLPLYLAGNTTALAVSKLVLGWPLLLAGIAIAGVMLLRGRTPLQVPHGPAEGDALER